MDIGITIKGQYQVIEHIGRGGMADVWSARDQRLRRMVAIKTIAAGLSAEADPLTLFEKEAQTIAQMEHPHILPIYDFGEYDGSLYIVMRYVTGGSLEDELQDGLMSVDEVLRIGDAIAKALDYAHENNVIHLDLKPPNILLDSGKSPYLADFGLATMLDARGRAQNPGSGTLLYMAPEQMTSETIDHRADIYAFSIMLFHMLSGQLPFEGRTTLAMRQIQLGEELPRIDEINATIPHEIDAVLRRGTAQDPSLRQNTHMAVMEELRQILQPVAATTVGIGAVAGIGYELETQRVETTDSALLEAVDIYSRARYNWQGGQGRFLLGVTHFMLMSEYYQNADFYALEIDHEGYQMLLRGAIEYNYELDYWWSMVDNDDRRWVCLHALRSGNTPARIRAMYRLETLPDDEQNPTIPRLVAQALEIEEDNNAKRAALKVLGTRARLTKRPTMKIKTEYRGRLLTTMTRLGIQMAKAGNWQQAIYTPEVDVLVAEQAFDDDREVAEFAARTVGKMRSLAAVDYLAQAQINGRSGALDALAFVRDEAPALPDTVSGQARAYAWITNTVRRLTANPLDGILRFVLAVLGGLIAMAEFVHISFRSQAFFDGQRWGNMIGIGLTFGLFIGITSFAANDMSRRLAGFWAWWQRLVVFGLLAILLGTGAFAGFTWLYYQYDPPGNLMLLMGLVFTLPLLLTGLLDLRGWQSLLLTTAMGFYPVLVAHRAFYEAGDSSVAFVAPVGLVFGLFVGWQAARRTTIQFRLHDNHVLSAFIGVGLGLLWAGLTTYAFTAIHQNILNSIDMTWGTVMWIFVAMLLFGTLVSYFLNTIGRLAVLITALVAFAAFFMTTGWQYFDYSFTIPVPATEPLAEFVYYDGVPLSPTAPTPLLYFDNPQFLIPVVLPMMFVIALGVNLLSLLKDWWSWLGKSQITERPGGWLGTTLIYTLVMTGLASVLALFSASRNPIWALGWSAWAFITFVFALATYRWALWGARGLIGSGIFFLVGGLFFDAVNIRFQASQGETPALLQSLAIDLPFIGWTPVIHVLAFWALWTVIVGVFVWGAMRRYLWGGIGLVVMLIGWFFVAIFSPIFPFLSTSIQGSVAVFALTNVALVSYALLPKYHLMEAGRFAFPHLFGVAAEPLPKAKPDYELETLHAPAKPRGTPDAQLETVASAKQTPTDESAPQDIATTPSAQVELSKQETERLNELLAAADMPATEEVAVDEMDTVEAGSVELSKQETERLNELLAAADMPATEEVAVDEIETVEAGPVELSKQETERLNELLAAADMPATEEVAINEMDTVEAGPVELSKQETERLNELLAAADMPVTTDDITQFDALPATNDDMDAAPIEFDSREPEQPQTTRFHQEPDVDETSENASDDDEKE